MHRQFPAYSAIKTGVDEATMFRFTEGMGLGMGGMEGTCGAIGAAAVLSGLKQYGSAR